MWGGEGEKEEENPGPCLSLQQSWLIACLLIVDHLQEVGHLALQGPGARDPARQSTLLLLSQGNLGRGESGIRGKRKVFLSKALALRNVT